MPEPSATSTLSSPAPLLSRGGANNRADRASYHLTHAQCSRLIRATHQAYVHGMPFNRFMTIGWGKSGLAPEFCVKATGKWFKLARDWMRSQGHRMSWAWVQEQGPILGAHIHALLHVPSGLGPTYSRRPMQWVRKVLEDYGEIYQAGSLQTQRIPPFYLPEYCLPRIWMTSSRFTPMAHALMRSPYDHDEADKRYLAYLKGVEGKMHYMLKCAPAEFEANFGLEDAGYKYWGNQSLVFGKRLGTWQFPSR